MDFLQSTARRVLLKAYLSSDHITAATGKTIAVQISKNGGAFGNPNAGATNATEIANGWYYVDLNTTDTGTLGPIITRGTEATIDDIERVDEVVASELLFKKNTAFNNFCFPMVDSSGNLVSGATVTATRSIDGANFASCANSPTELADSNGYKIDFAAADLNGKNIRVRMTAAGCKDLDFTIITQN